MNSVCFQDSSSSGADLFVVAGREVWALSPENGMLVQGLQLVRERLSFRLSEAVYTISVIEREPVDWVYVIHTARQIGTLASLSCYLCYVTQIYERVFGRRLLPEALARQLRLHGWGRVEFTKGTFRSPILRAGGRLYVRQLEADVRSGRWENVGRLALLPILAAAAGLQKLTAPAPAPAQRRPDFTSVTASGPTPAELRARAP